jgi:hypothetical protein
VSIVPYMGVQFALYDVLRECLADNQHSLTRSLRAAGDAASRTLPAPLGSRLAAHLATLAADPGARPHADPRDPVPMWVASTAGLLSGAVGKALSYPLDVLKKRYQVRTFRHSLFSANPHTDATAAPAPSMLRLARDMAHAEGWRAFYKGVQPAVLKTGCASALTFAVFEAVSTLMDRGR